MAVEHDIIDFHTHLMNGGLYTDDTNTDPVQYALKEMNQSGVQRSVVLGVGWDDQLYDNNELIREAVNSYPDRFIGFVGVDPHRAEKAVQVIDEAIQDWGFKGIKMHQWLQMFPTNAPLVYPIMERAEAYGIPVLFHSGTPPYTTPLLIADLARQFPKVPVVIAHMGKTTLYYDCLTVLDQVPNLYCDFSGNPLVGVLEWGIKHIGAEKFLYGSDEFGAGPGQAYGIAQIQHMNISDTEKNMILYENALKLLKLEEVKGKVKNP